MQVYLSPIAAAVQRCAQVVDQKAGEETGRKKEKKKRCKGGGGEVGGQARGAGSSLKQAFSLFFPR